MADRITVSGDVLVEEDDTSGDVTIHVDQGTVSQAATEPNEIPRFDQLGGGGMWEEDANSPVSETSVSSVDYIVDGDYDFVWCEYQAVDVGFIDLRFNGDGGDNYRYMNATGTNSNGNDRVESIGLTEFGSTTAGVLLFGEYQDGIKCTPIDRQGNTSAVTGSDNANVSHPLTQINLIGNDAGDWEVRVFGRSF